MNAFFPQIYGSGDQTRSFQYVSDLVDGLVALMASNYSLPVNIGNPTEYSIKGKFLFPLIVKVSSRCRVLGVVGVWTIHVGLLKQL